MNPNERVGRLLERFRGAAVAARYRAFAVTDTEKAIIAEAGVQVLKLFPDIPAACVVMSALYASALQDMKQYPAYVAAGKLSIKQIRIFGSANAFDGAALFSQSNPSWDGHAWVVVGGYIADVSIFRTAYGRGCHPALKAHVLKEFGTGKGLFMAKIEDAAKSGFNYIPQYILSDAQMTGLAGGAMALATGQI